MRVKIPFELAISHFRNLPKEIKQFHKNICTEMCIIVLYVTDQKKEAKFPINKECLTIVQNAMYML